MAQVTDVQDTNKTGVKQAKLGNTTITFGMIPEPPAWRTGDQQYYHSQRCAWVIKEDERRSVYVVRTLPEQGKQLDLRACLAKLAVEDLAL